MSDNYTRLPTPALAWKYDKQPQPDWPEWVRTYEIATPVGLQRIGAGPGILLVPTKGGTTINVPAGDFVVLEGKALSIVKGGDFPNMFQPADAVQASDELKEQVAPAPAPEAAPEA